MQVRHSDLNLHFFVLILDESEHIFHMFSTRKQLSRFSYIYYIIIGQKHLCLIELISILSAFYVAGQAVSSLALIFAPALCSKALLPRSVFYSSKSDIAAITCLVQGV